jgi:uncharacterized protein
MLPLLTRPVAIALEAARAGHWTTLSVSVDLGRSVCDVTLNAQTWSVADRPFPYPMTLKDRTIYYWDGAAFQPASRFGRSLIKLVPTEWGAPTFEIDGIKMLPTAQLSPVVDAANKVAMIEPRGKAILDCCGGLGYFAVQCLYSGAARIVSFEKNPDVIWLRSLNPWSPEGCGKADVRLELQEGDVSECITALSNESFDAILHDPPRFGIAGELYSQTFYDHLARVLKRNGRLFHYTGTPNKLTTGRDVPNEVSKRLRNAGFTTEIRGDGVLAVKRVSRR